MRTPPGSAAADGYLTKKNRPCFLARGADVNYPEGDWIWTACTGNNSQRDDPRYVQALLDKGARIDTVLRGAQALHFAAKAGFTGVMEVLLDNGAPVDGRSEKGETPLFYALKAGPRADLVKSAALLLARGADPTLEDRLGKSPLGIARRMKRPEKERIVSMFEAASPPRAGVMSLRYATRASRSGVVPWISIPTSAQTSGVVPCFIVCRTRIGAGIDEHLRDPGVPAQMQGRLPGVRPGVRIRAATQQHPDRFIPSMLYRGVQGRPHHGVHPDLPFECDHACIGLEKPAELVGPSENSELAGIHRRAPVDQVLRQTATTFAAGQRRTQRRVAIAVGRIQRRSVIQQDPGCFRGHNHVEWRFSTQARTGCRAGIFRQHRPNGVDIIQQARGVEVDHPPAFPATAGPLPCAPSGRRGGGRSSLHRNRYRGSGPHHGATGFR